MLQLLGLGLAFCLAGCQRNAIVSSPPSTSRPAKANEIARGAQPLGKSDDIRGLIEQLVYHVDPNVRQPVVGDSDEGKRIRERMRSCQAAFDKLSELREEAFPYLIAHLDDKRPSIPFRNHSIGSTVGDACYSNIHFQLLDRPEGYSEYGYAREGRDGKDHPKPYWSSESIFEGGLKGWLDGH